MRLSLPVFFLGSCTGTKLDECPPAKDGVRHLSVHVGQNMLKQWQQILVSLIADQIISVARGTEVSMDQKTMAKCS